tara:strand:+ start:766 stop:1662 length:897 start_codon:yes stop_codon:yes gene_type:complete
MSKKKASSSKKKASSSKKEAGSSKKEAGSSKKASTEVVAEVKSKEITANTEVIKSIPNTEVINTDGLQDKERATKDMERMINEAMRGPGSDQEKEAKLKSLLEGNGMNFNKMGDMNAPMNAPMGVPMGMPAGNVTGKAAPVPAVVPAAPSLQEKVKVPTKLEIRADQMGYGVYASADIEDGEIIEEAPISTISFRTKDGQTNDKVPSILRLSIPISCQCDDCKDNGLRLTMSSGYIQLYNHAAEPNARILQHKINKRIFTVESTKSIKAGEQIFINYGPNYPEQWLSPEMSGVAPNSK